MSKDIVVIPSFNEYKSLKKIVKLLKGRIKILVINDGSTDKTYSLLKKNKIETINNKKNLGYELSLIKSFYYLKDKYPKVKNIVTFDADGEHKVNDIYRLLV